MLSICILNFRFRNALASCILTTQLRPFFVTYIFTYLCYVTNYHNHLLNGTKMHLLPILHLGTISTPHAFLFHAVPRKTCVELEHLK